MISDTWLALNSLSLIANGIYTLENQCPVLPFDYIGQGLTNDNYIERNYDENDYDFAN